MQKKEKIFKKMDLSVKIWEKIQREVLLYTIE